MTPITTYSSLPRQRGKYDGRHSDDECSLAKQVTKSCENIYSNGVSVDESMSKFLANVNRENLESLLDFYEHVTTNEVRKKNRGLMRPLNTRSAVNLNCRVKLCKGSLYDICHFTLNEP